MTSQERESLKETKDDKDKLLYKGAFDDFDWNKNGTIPTRVSSICWVSFCWTFVRDQCFITTKILLEK